MSGSILGLSMWNLWWQSGNGTGLSPRVSVFSLSLKLHKCSVHIHAPITMTASSNTAPKNRTRLGTFTSIIIRLALKKFSLPSCDNELQSGIQKCPNSNTEKVTGERKLCVLHLQILLLQCYVTHNTEHSDALFPATLTTVQCHATLYGFCAHL